jgi:glycerophosphoryl diester phosphodiesterase
MTAMDGGVTWMQPGGRPRAPAVLAQQCGADAVEVDLVQTACGALALLHDAFVVDGRDWRWVRDLTLDDLAQVLGEPPSTHTDLLDVCARVGLGCYAEVKAASPATLERFTDDPRVMQTG